MLRIAVFLLAVLVSSGATAQPSSSYLLRPCYGALSVGATGCGYGPGPVPSGGYTGPLNIIPSSTLAASLDCASSALATGTTNVINYRRASDNSAQNGVCLRSGLFDLASALTFAGTDATCTTGAMVGTTTLTLTGCSSTPTVKDTISGTVATGSLAQPAYITAVGSFVAGSGTVTLNVAQTVTLTNVKATVALFVATWYNQSGSAGNPAQVTSGTQPQLLPTCSDGNPCVLFNGSQFLTASYSSTVVGTWSFVGQRTSVVLFALALGTGAAANDPNFGWINSANLITLYAGISTTLAANDNAWHAAQAVNTAGGTSSRIAVDGGAPSTVNPGIPVATTGVSIGAASNGTSGVTGMLHEVFLWDGTQASNAQIAALSANQRARWGF